MFLITTKPARSIWHLRDRATTLGDLHENRLLCFFSASSRRWALKCKRLTIFSARRVKGKVAVAEMDSHFLTNAAFRCACERRRGPFCHFKRLRCHHRALPSVCAFFFTSPDFSPSARVTFSHPPAGEREKMKGHFR